MPVTDKQIDLLKNLKINNPNEYKNEIEKIERILFNEYCFKKKYKEKCEPAYCVDSYTNKCQYLHEMRKIDKELDIWSR